MAINWAWFIYAKNASNKVFSPSTSRNNAGPAASRFSTGTAASRPNTGAPAVGEKRRSKCICIVLSLVVVVAAAAVGIALLIITVVELKTPKLRIVGAVLTSLSAGTPQNPALQATVTAELAVKNPNYGSYNYRNTTVEFFYAGAKVGQAPVPDSGAGRRSTKKMFLVAALDLNAGGGAQLSADLSAGAAPITSSARMRGRVMSRKRSTSMNCVMQIVTATRSIANLLCE